MQYSLGERVTREGIISLESVHRQNYEADKVQPRHQQPPKCKEWNFFHLTMKKMYHTIVII